MFEVDADWVDKDRARVIAAERKRCLRAVALAQPETSGVSGMVLQQRTGHDWIVSVKRVIAKAIAEPQEAASRDGQPSEPPVIPRDR